mmetsp:Transcript_76981/g.223483  ORF Transcript_76981/g.223483 Transcript_76981/m.223483 type:complete len:185 (+) Transcript_76981:126-680(+)
MALTSFLGCLPLQTAVYVTFLQCFMRALLLLNFFSSKDSLNIVGLEVPPMAQVAWGTFALMGPALAILAGFGALFRMEGYIRALARYSAVFVTIDFLLFVSVSFTGEVCTAIAHEVLIDRGPMFVCVIINLSAVFWSLVYVAFEAYLAFAVWSQAGIIQKGEFAELLRYESTFPLGRTPHHVGM